MYIWKRAEYDQAKREIGRAKDRDDQAVDAHIVMGRILTREAWGQILTGQKPDDDWSEKAQKAFIKALKLDPDSDAAMYWQGEAHLVAFDFEMARRAFQDAIAHKGPFAGRADARMNVLQRIDRAAPGTEIGKQIALVPEIDRADLAALLVEELRLPEIVEQRRPEKVSTAFVPYGERTETEPSERTVDDEVWNHPLRGYVEEVLELELAGLESFPDGTFAPDRQITKGEYALAVQSILVLVTGKAELQTRFIGQQSLFEDVRSDHPFYNAVALCTSRGIIEPRDKVHGLFGIADSISGADALLTIRQLQNSLRMTF